MPADKLEVDKEMFEAAKKRDARPCSLLYHNTKQRGDSMPFNAVWMFEAPYAHPMWHQYAVLLMDLTTPFQRPPVLYMPNATHEVLCFAVDPDHPVVPNPDNSKPNGWKYLPPPNFAYQFISESDAVALKRIDDLVMKFIHKEVSPDTDYSSVHDKLFADGISLRRSIFDGIKAQL